LRSGMNARNLLVIALVAFAAADLPQSACDFCQTIVPSISEMISTGMEEADIIAKLNLACAEMEQISPEYRAKCDGFVGTYADYMVDMITATTNAGEFCKSFGLCDSDLNEPEYTVLFPTISKKNVTYAIQTQTPSTSYKFKIFLGNSTELFNTKSVSLTFAMTFDQEEQKTVMTVQNEDHITNMMTCHADDACTLELINPGDGVWYFIDITTQEPTDSAFRVNFNATEEAYKCQSWVWTTRHRHGLSLISFMLLVSTVGTILCLCISCCLRLQKGRLERSRRCKNAVVIEQGVPALQDYEMQYPMVGYYYFPEQQTQMDFEVPHDFWAPVPPQPQPQAPTFEQMN